MFKLIDTLRAKPSDRMIRLVRLGFAILLLVIITFGIEYTHWNYTAIPDAAKYILYIFPLIGLIRAAVDPGLFRRKVWKWTIFGLGVSMILMTTILLETDTEQKKKITASPTVSGEITLDDIESSNQNEVFIIDTDFWIGFFGFWVALIGLTLTSKNITKKNERYGEKVTKIRV